MAQFTVRTSKPELVSPAEPTPYEFKPLSDIDDQQAFRFQVSVMLFYPHNPSVRTSRDPRLVIKGALAKALVYYYPLAGRLREVGPNGKLMVECTGEGILYIQADSDMKLEQLNLGKRIQPSFPNLDQLLSDVPGSAGILNCPLMLFQVTRLLCGGFVVAVRLNHTLSDAPGLTQFLNAVAEIAQGAETPSVLPVWEREFFKARDPPRVTHVHREYTEYDQQYHLPASEATKDSDDDDILLHDDIVDGSVFFGPTEISVLRSHLPPHLRHSCSSFDIVTACLWRCRTIALNPAPTELARLLCVTSGRGKLQPPLPVGYYGNAFAIPAAITTSGELCKGPLGYAVELVKKAKSAMNGRDYLQSVSDFMVLNNRPPLPLTRTTYLVSDNSRVGWTEVDFGWGKPVYGGPAESTSLGKVPGAIGFYLRLRNDEGEDGILVPIRLPKLCMGRFVSELRGMISTTSTSSQYARL